MINLMMLASLMPVDETEAKKKNNEQWNLSIGVHLGIFFNELW